VRVVLDIETNGLINPDKVWVIVCKDIDTGRLYIFRKVTEDESERNRFLDFCSGVSCYIGHNILGYDLPVLRTTICDPSDPRTKSLYENTYGKVCDTLIVSKLKNYARDGHSIEAYGEEFGFPKINFTDFSKYSTEMEEYCVRDVEIGHLVYNYLSDYLSNRQHHQALDIEHKFQVSVNRLHTNGFAFNRDAAERLLKKISRELEKLDTEILNAFPPREVLIREFTPRLTKFGTINKSSVPRALHDRIHEFVAGEVFRHTKQEPFNPASHKQIIDVLHEAGWKPVEKTKTHVDLERLVQRASYNRTNKSDVVQAQHLSEALTKLKDLAKYGWKISENNLQTLPSSAPKPALTLSKRIMLESRRRTLEEWLGCCEADGRIHGKFYAIGSWTHRMSHQNPNTANIPTEAKLYGKEMRSLWIAPKGRLLVGCDAEGIQLRIFAHYIDDAEFTYALVHGKKEDKSDPHSLNQRILGAKSRAIAKRFIFAYLLGAGIGKLAEILELSTDEARRSLERLMDRYTGLQLLKETFIPRDAKRGWFEGIDGRSVPIIGADEGSRKHLCMSGYLQNGETVAMRAATVKFEPQLLHFDALLVDLVHDEWQVEVPNDMKIALQVAELMAQSLKEVGEEFKLNCPLAGSYWSDDNKDYTIGMNWYQTH
jgi:DNA polymerase-1